MTTMHEHDVRSQPVQHQTGRAADAERALAVAGFTYCLRGRLDMRP